MPKLNSWFHKPRIDAYQIAIDALAVAYDEIDVTTAMDSYERRTEYATLAKRLMKQRQKFIDKFNIEP